LWFLEKDLEEMKRVWLINASEVRNTFVLKNEPKLSHAYDIVTNLEIICFKYAFL
jgi:hypothetical protein